MRTAVNAAPVSVLLLALLLPTCSTSPTAPAAPDLVITTEQLPPAMRGEPYAEGIHATGGDGDYEWEIVAGELPVGLELSADDLGVDAFISGTPDDIETATFTVQVRSGDGQTDTQEFTLVVLPEPDPLAIQTRRVPPALAGGPYAVRLRANGGDGENFEWELVTGSLPAGLSLTSGGRIEGTPPTPETATFTIEVRSGGMSTRWTYELRVVPRDVDAYRLTIFEVTELPESVRPHVEEAIALWEAALIGDLPPVAIPENFFQPSHCGGFGNQINGTSTDDILIILNVAPIDGPGGVLGRAGPCAIREGSSLPFAGIVTLDADDLIPLVGTETLTDIIAHEIAHALGFGSLWELLGLVAGAGTDDPRFTGERAVAEYQDLGGTGDVPLETQGGDATAEVHWRKSVFREELMTGFIEPVGIDQPSSRVTIASWEDLGYVVDMSAADSFTLAGAVMAARVEDDRHAWGELGYDIVYTGPVLVLQPGGRARTLELQ